MNRKPTNEKADGKKFRLEIPLDASGIEDFKPDRPIKVVVQRRDGSTQEQSVQLDKQGKGIAAFAFDQNPGSLRVVVGPDDASAEELLGMQTIAFDLSGQQWVGRTELTLEPTLISAYYWYWWPIWCRTFTIRGRVLCPDGKPVAGATVCAYDVDAFWWWCSTQQVGCATTDLSGSFTIKFRWCCGWWPWWWWLHRPWRLEPLLAERIVPILQRELKLTKIPTPGPQPDPVIFEQLLTQQDPKLSRRPPLTTLTAGIETKTTGMMSAVGEVGDATHKATTAFDPARLESLRMSLIERLPVIPDLDRLRLWPWWPWQPWWDCTPDIIFRVTQNCQGHDQVIVDETCWDTRWDIPTTLNVTLTANSQACCVGDRGDPEGDCLWITDACDDFVGFIGGNIGALAAPAGYLSPGAVSVFGDRPYAATIPIQGRFGLGAAADYYEFEWSDNNGVTWHDMAPGTVAGFTRWYIGHPLVGVGPVSSYPQAFPIVNISGRNVIESRLHFEANNGAGTWGITRGWDAATQDFLVQWLTENNFADGTYRLRVKSWTLSGGALVNPRYLPLCDTTDENKIILTIDNRLVGAASGHPPSTPDHPCGPGTVHLCTLEPDTDILSVKIIHTNATETTVDPCGNVPITTTDTLQVDFFAYDPDGHLAEYTLIATYGENLYRDLLALGGTLTPLVSPPPPVPAAVQLGPTYADARSANPPPLGGAAAPIWRGGALRLRVSAPLAFPETCCYQLELRAYKRTIVNCDHNLAHANLSEYSFMIVV